MQHYIRAGAFNGFIEAINKSGCDADEVFREAGICPHILDDPDRYIDFRTFAQAQKSAAERTGRDDFGLLMSSLQYRDNLKCLGVLASVLDESPTLLASLERTCRFLSFHTNAVSITYHPAGPDHTCLATHLMADEAPGTEFLLDSAFCIVVEHIQKYGGPSWRPEMLTLQRKRPSSVEKFYELFGYAIKFGASKNEMIIPNSILNFVLEDRDIKRFERFSELVDYRLGDAPRRIHN